MSLLTELKNIFCPVFYKYAAPTALESAGFFRRLQMPQILIFIICENPRNLRTLFPKQFLPPRPPIVIKTAWIPAKHSSRST